MRVKQEFVVCDVCEKHIYGFEHTQITFTYDGKSFAFDSCYSCLCGNSNIRKVYRKITETIKSALRKGANHEQREN